MCLNLSCEYEEAVAMKIVYKNVRVCGLLSKTREACVKSSK
jgi:hypothetical protein